METRLSMFIHDRSQNPLPALSQFSRAEIKEIISGSGWFRFCVVRHPFDRFFSAWRDKVFLCEPKFERYIQNNDEKFIEFSFFVDSVLRGENPRSCDPHWRSQVALLLPEKIAYTNIYDISNVSRLIVDLQQHLACAEISQTIRPLERQNEGFEISSHGFLTGDVIDGLREFYRADFETFGFAQRVGSTESVKSAKAFTNGFTEAIFDRNRVIGEYIRHAYAAERVERLRQHALHRRVMRRFRRYSRALRPYFGLKIAVARSTIPRT